MKLFPTLFLAAGFAFAALPVSAQVTAPGTNPLGTDAPAGTYSIDPTHASVTFKVAHLGLSSYTARFTKIDATLKFDPAHPEGAKLTVSIDPASIRTDYPFPEKENFDKVLAESDKWFNAGKFKAITFASTGIKMTGDKTADVTGTLTLLGVAKPVTMKVTFNKGYASHPMSKKAALGFSGTATVKRSEFGMTNLVPFVGDDVAVLIEAELSGG